MITRETGLTEHRTAISGIVGATGLLQYLSIKIICPKKFGPETLFIGSKQILGLQKIVVQKMLGRKMYGKEV